MQLNTQQVSRVSTFVQFAIYVLWQMWTRLNIGGVNVECLAVGPTSLPLFHSLSAHTQYGAAEVLDLRVLQHLKFKDWHPDGEAYEIGRASLGEGLY